MEFAALLNRKLAGLVVQFRPYPLPWSRFQAEVSTFVGLNLSSIWDHEALGNLWRLRLSLDHDDTGQDQDFHELGPRQQMDRWSEIMNDALERSRHMCEAYWEYLHVLDIDVPRRDYFRLWGKLLLLAAVGQMEKYLKFETASLLAASLSQTPDNFPDRPPWLTWAHQAGRLFSGATGRKLWMRLVLRKRPRDVQLAYGLYHVKRVAMPLDQAQVSDSLKENLDALTLDRGRLLHPVHGISEDEEEQLEADLEYQVRRTVRELFHDASLSGWKPGVSRRIPTLSACFERSKALGGAFGEIFNLRRPGELHRDTSYYLAFRELRGSLRYKCSEVLIYLPPAEDDDILRGGLISESMDRVEVRREPILEPFKVRVVSMGNAQVYQRARNYQRHLWSMMQRSPSFRLTGAPIDASDVDAVAWPARNSGLYSVMVSGDYKAATDNLNPLLSEAAMDEYCILARVPMEDRAVLLGCLTRHRIEGRDQQWGQLMGSPISFPILCIVNAAVTRWVMETSYGMFLPLSLGPLRVNGDDILFCLPPGEYHSWKIAVTVAGLTPSVGKNYVSRDYAVLNSDLFLLPEDWDRPETALNIKDIPRRGPRRVPTIKMNLLRGTQDVHCERRSGVNLFCGQELAHGKTLAGRMEELIRGFHPEMADRLINRCVRWVRPVLTALPPVSWWTARDKGGLGLPVTRNVDIAIHHRRLAAHLTCRPATRRDWELRQLLEWIRQPGPVYSDLVNQIYSSLTLPLNLGWSLVDRSLDGQQRDDGPPGKLLHSMLESYSHWGPDVDLVDQRLKLKRWEDAYWRAVHQANRRSKLIRPMHSRNCITPSTKIYVEDVPILSGL